MSGRRGSTDFAILDHKLKRARLSEPSNAYQQAPAISNLRGNTPKLLPYNKATPKVVAKIRRASSIQRHTPRWETASAAHTPVATATRDSKEDLKVALKKSPATPTLKQRSVKPSAGPRIIRPIAVSVPPYRLQPFADPMKPTDAVLAELESGTLDSMEGWGRHVELLEQHIARASLNNAAREIRMTVDKWCRTPGERRGDVGAVLLGTVLKDMMVNLPALTPWARAALCDLCYLVLWHESPTTRAFISRVRPLVQNLPLGAANHNLFSLVSWCGEHIAVADAVILF